MTKASGFWISLRDNRFNLLKGFSFIVGILHIVSIVLFCLYDYNPPASLDTPSWYKVCYFFRVMAGLFSVYTAFRIWRSGREAKKPERFCYSVQLSMYILIIACATLEDPVFKSVLKSGGSDSLSKACKILPAAYLIIAALYTLLYIISNWRGQSKHREKLQAKADEEAQLAEQAAQNQEYAYAYSNMFPRELEDRRYYPSTYRSSFFFQPQGNA